MNTPVIYKISSLISDKIYVGSAVNFKRRYNRHMSDLKLKRHNNPKLQCFVNKHGIDCLVFSILEEVQDRHFLIEREQYYIDTLTPWFNCNTTANSPKGRIVTQESRRKMSLSQTGKKRNFAPEFLAALIERNKARQWSDEAKLKCKIANTGRVKTPYEIECIKKANTGRPRTKSQINAIILSNSTRTVTQKTKDAVAKQNRERVISDETRKKLSEAVKKRWALKRLNN